MLEAKPWWTSKTIWTNLLALVGSVALACGIDPGRWAEMSTVTLAVANLALRMVTKDSVTLIPEGK
jgi:hypothetical protein